MEMMGSQLNDCRLSEVSVTDWANATTSGRPRLARAIHLTRSVQPFERLVDNTARSWLFEEEARYKALFVFEATWASGTQHRSADGRGQVGGACNNRAVAPGTNNLSTRGPPCTRHATHRFRLSYCRPRQTIPFSASTHVGRRKGRPS
jgi:hypothetical protein